MVVIPVKKPRLRGARFAGSVLVGDFKIMMGNRQVEQVVRPVYEFSLEEHVPAGHLLRSIDRFVELDGLRRELASFYSAIVSAR
jgi:hypothetical protein